jgi:hypothetical protein
MGGMATHYTQITFLIGGIDPQIYRLLKKLKSFKFSIDRVADYGMPTVLKEDLYANLIRCDYLCELCPNPDRQ